MNLREGTRRLALFLGAVGAILGGFASYLELQSVLNQRERHIRFEQLATSDFVKQDRKVLQASPDFIPPWNPVQDVRAEWPGLKDWSDQRILTNLSDPAKFRTALPQYAQLDDNSIKENITWMKKNGIKAINWSHDYGVESIVTEDGQTLNPTPAPNRWLYLLAAILPLLGLVLPWGLIRAVGWVGAGFVAGSR